MEEILTIDNKEYIVVARCNYEGNNYIYVIGEDNNNDVAKLTVHEYMKGLHDVDALILGCTHYPLFADIFRAELKPKAEIINTGTIIANNLQLILGNSLLNCSNTTGKSEIFLTDIECNFISVAKKLLSEKDININKC